MSTSNNSVILKTNIPYLKLCNSGKVRDIYESDESLLIIATDKISAFDYVLPEPIFTPSTKATSGHDENITFDEVVKITGKEILT
ncbi:MAG: hypothetical protein NUV86_12770 [Candidatus Scalindua sp.]|nr:hypothetical protein [Candidatus Scalindua sp.]MCR4345044.1 hypothetical protein [Candidatus Scalindua sp.]